MGRHLATFRFTTPSPPPRQLASMPRAVLPLDLTGERPVARFADVEAFASLWAHAVTDGALRLEAPLPRHLGSPVEAVVVIGDDRFPAQQLVVLDDSRLVVELQLTPAIRSCISRHGHECREGRRAAHPAGVTRGSERFETALEVRFADLPHLVESYVTDISNSGLFIACEPQPQLNAHTTVRLTLPAGQTVEVPVEVVRRVTTGEKRGVGVRFDAQAGALGPIEALLQHYGARRPRVLVVDDEAIWRSTLIQVLRSLNAEVILASDGHEGLVKLTDLLFEIDLVILDLHMPNLDGRGLLRRVRKQGNELGLRMFLFSGAGPDELEAVADEHLANAVLSKSDSLDVLVERLRVELGKPPVDLRTPVPFTDPTAAQGR